MPIISRTQIVPPSVPGWKSVGLQLKSSVAVNQSPFTLRSQRYAFDGKQYIAELELPPMKLTTALPWQGFFHRLNGAEGSFLLSRSFNITGSRWQNGAAPATHSLSATVSSVDTALNRLTISSTAFVDGDQVLVSSTGSLPGGLEANHPYYVNVVSATVIELLEDPDDLLTQVNIVSSGSGTITVATYLANGWLISDGWTTGQVLWAGDIISIGNKLIVVLEDVTPSGGIARIKHDRSDRVFSVDSTISTAERATGEFFLEESPILTFGMERLLNGIQFRAFEVV